MFNPPEKRKNASLLHKNQLFREKNIEVSCFFIEVGLKN